MQYQLYNSRGVARQYSSARADPFAQHQLVSSILCPPGYQSMGSPAKHVTVVSQQPPPPQLQIQPPIISQQVCNSYQIYLAFCKECITVACLLVYSLELCEMGEGFKSNHLLSKHFTMHNNVEYSI